MNSVDRKIISVLKYGKKKKVEVVELVGSEAADKTIRSHLEDLQKDDNSKVIKDKDNKLFFLQDQKKEPVRPKPFADQEEVNRVLFNIQEELGIVQSEIEEFYDDKKLYERILTSIGTTGSEWSETEIRERGDNAVKYFSELYNITGSRHYVLQNSENLEAFFKIFEQILDTLEAYDPDIEELRLPDELFELFFMSANNIYDNWYDGKEHEKFDSKIAERAERVLSVINQSEAAFHTELRMLLTHISRENGKEVYLSMVKSGNYKQERLLEDAFYTYDVFNDIHNLLRDLDEAREQVDDQDIAQEISHLGEEIVRLYTREVQETV